MPREVIELKPCPFCGALARFRDRIYGLQRHFRVECGNLHCQVNSHTALFDTKAEAAAAWNRRAVS